MVLKTYFWLNTSGFLLVILGDHMWCHGLILNLTRSIFDVAAAVLGNVWFMSFLVCVDSKGFSQNNEQVLIFYLIILEY